MSESDVAAGSHLTGGTRTLLTLAAAVVVLVGIWFARDILAPAAVAAVVVIIANPLRRPLERRGWPSWLASTAVVALSYAILAALAALLVPLTLLVRGMLLEPHPGGSTLRRLSGENGADVCAPVWTPQQRREA